MFCRNWTIPENCVVCQKGEFFLKFILILQCIYWRKKEEMATLEFICILEKTNLQSLNLYIGKEVHAIFEFIYWKKRELCNP